MRAILFLLACTDLFAQLVDYPLQVRRKPMFDVRQYGARGNGIANDTAAIQAAINAARAIAGPSCGGTGVASGQVFLPPGSYVVSTLNMTNSCGLQLIGSGSWSTFIYGAAQSVSRPIIDMTACRSCAVKQLLVRGHTAVGGVPAVIPTVGILLAESAALGDCTANHIEHAGTLGYFTRVAVYIFGCTDNFFEHSGIQLWGGGALVVLGIDANNTLAITSPYMTLATGPRPSGDQTFIQQEVHDLTFISTPSPSAVVGILLNSAYAVRFFGGNNGGSQNSSNAQVYFGGTGNRNITFSNMQFYSDDGTPAVNVFYANGTQVLNLTIENCMFQSASTRVIGGTASASYKGLRLTGIDYDFAGAAVDIPNMTPATTVAIEDAYLSLSGKAFTPGGSIKNVILINPGTITLQAGATWDRVSPPTTFTFSGKPAFAMAGSQVFLSDGASPSAPCTGSSTGAMATYQNGALKCY